MRMIKESLMLMLFLLTCVSLTAGLELSASNGGSTGSSSTSVSYGATIQDYAIEHIELNPGDGVLSNTLSGSGDLPYSTIGTSDANGNSVFVCRSVYGKAGTTKWAYDWKTYGITSSTAGNGVGAWMSLTATNAYMIYGKGSASNAEGDAAEAYMTVGSVPGTGISATSSLSGYYVNPTAYSSEARVSQKATSASSAYNIKVSGYATNAEHDSANSYITLTKGTVSSPKTSVYSGKTATRSNPSASLIVTSGTGTLYANATNAEGDVSLFNLKVTNGKISNPNFYAWTGTGFAETKGSVSYAYGTLTDINSKGVDKALGYQEHWSWNHTSNGWDRTTMKVERGEGDFAARKKSNSKFTSVSVKTRSTKSDVVVSTSGFGSNTALILDPRRYEFVTDIKGSEIRNTVMSYLKNKGYAVTYYSDSAVSKEKVKQMDEYRVSVINTHASSNSIYLSRSSDGTTWDTMSAAELKSAYTKSNGMTLIVGCNSFLNTGSGTWADAVSKANVRGGTTSSWAIVYCRSFINNFFKSMAGGSTASSANSYAAGSTGAKLRLLGNSKFTL